MKYQYWTSILILLIMAQLTGCRTEHMPMVNTVSNAVQAANIHRIIDMRVITDTALSSILYLVEVRESNTNDGYKRFQVFMKNYCNAPYTFSYRFNWYDANGVEIEAADDEMWKQVHVVPGDDVTLTSVAPEKSCKDFKLRIVSRY